MHAIHHRTLPASVRDALRAVRRCVRHLGRESIEEVGFNVIGRAVGDEPCGWIGFRTSEGGLGRVYFYGAECAALQIFARTFRYV